MIRALIVGDLSADPQERTSKNGNLYATARISVPMGEAGRVFCSVIAFDNNTVDRLLQLRAGTAVALAGTLKVATWTANDGTAKPSMDMVADEVASTTPRSKKPKRPQSAVDHSTDDPFADLPGADDLGGQY